MRDPFEQLRRIQEAITKIAEYTKKGRRSFDREEAIRLSIIHCLQTMSDAALAISPAFRDHHPEIPWEQMIGFRDFLTHYYVEMDRDAVWKLVSHDLPALKAQIDAELAEEERVTEHSKSINPVHARKGTATALDELLHAKREDIIRTAGKYGASNIRLFGSVARGEADAESDIDLLVDIEPGRTLFDLSELLMDLQDLLGREVDIVTEKGLNARIRERVLREAMPL
jgi:predicted nucleotidyltransferase/uncharacterized protein with HEPN domain